MWVGILCLNKNEDGWRRCMRMEWWGYRVSLSESLPEGQYQEHLPWILISFAHGS